MAALFILSIALQGGPARADTPRQRAIKARYLYKFAPFVQWPANAFESPAAPLVICIAGQDPFGPALDQAGRSEPVNGRPVMVRRIDVIHPAMGCHILFEGSGLTEESLRAIAHEPVLTVTDSSTGGSGGIINFVTMAGRVRFTVDKIAAQERGLTISSKLLGRAVNVAR
jgi:hypothetical protein